jgi:hypothetical protein
MGITEKVGETELRLRLAQNGPKAPAAAGQGLLSERSSPTLY